MPTQNTALLERSDRELVFTRLLDAPRELVFAAWTDPEHIGQWWGPSGFTTTTQSFELRPGGSWRFVMHGPDGRDYPNRIVYSEIIKPERLVYAHADDQATEPVNFHVTATFEQQGQQTKLTLRMLFRSAAELDATEQEYGAIDGAQQTLERLSEYLQTSQS